MTYSWAKWCINISCPWATRITQFAHWHEDKVFGAATLGGMIFTSFCFICFDFPWFVNFLFPMTLEWHSFEKGSDGFKSEIHDLEVKKKKR